MLGAWWSCKSCYLCTDTLGNTPENTIPLFSKPSSYLRSENFLPSMLARWITVTFWSRHTLNGRLLGEFCREWPQKTWMLVTSWFSFWTPRNPRMQLEKANFFPQFEDPKALVRMRQAELWPEEPKVGGRGMRSFGKMKWEWLKCCMYIYIHIYIFIFIYLFINSIY